MRILACLLVTVLLGLSGSVLADASGQGGIQAAVRDYRAAHEQQILGEFVHFLSIPNRASDAPDIERNAAYIKAMLESRGLTVRLLRVAGAPPVVLGELRTPGGKPTIGIYAHYDGQPVDPSQWQSPPFAPVLRDQSGKPVDWVTAAKLDPAWRIYARSAGDDKAPIEATMAALDALHAAHTPLAVNVKFLFEGEEEAGSPHLADILKRHPEALDADVWLLCDGPVHQSGRMQVFFGARGDSHLEITTYGPARPLHSGHYGNWAPNPVVLLTHLIDGMRDMDGNILIPGFYADVRPLTAAEEQALAKIPAPDAQLEQELAIPSPEGGGAPLAKQILKPALNVTGIQAGHVGADATNTIESQATASIDLRLVPDQTPETVQKEIEAYIAHQGFFIVHSAPDLATRRAHAHVVLLQWDPGYPAYRASMDDPATQGVVQAIEAANGGPIIQVVSLGGSVPMYLFEGAHHTPVMGVPIANYDDNQHAANENLRLQNLWDAIQIYAAIFTRYGAGRPAD